MVAQTRTPRSTWIDAGLAALASGGPDAVRVDLLAKTLGVTRGGFYWHFENRGVFLDALLDAWEHRSTDDVLDRVEAEGGDARAKVRKAGMLTFSKDCCRSTSRCATGPAARSRWPDVCVGSTTGHGLPAHPDRRFTTIPDDVEVRAMLAFSLAIGSHFIAADHGGRSPARVLERAAQRLLA